jgi:hypothetical protein
MTPNIIQTMKQVVKANVLTISTDHALRRCAGSSPVTGAVPVGGAIDEAVWATGAAMSSSFLTMDRLWRRAPALGIRLAAERDGGEELASSRLA